MRMPETIWVVSTTTTDFPLAIGAYTDLTDAQNAAADDAYSYIQSIPLTHHHN